MATTKVVLFQTNKNKAGESPLYIRITKDRKIKYVSLGVNIFPKDWDEVHCKVKKSHPNYLRINSYIQHKATEAVDVVLEMVTASKWVRAKSIKQKLFGSNGIAFIPYAEKFILTYKEKNQIGSYLKAKAIIDKLKKFIASENFTFDDISVEFLKQYETHLRVTCKNGNTTIHGNFKVLNRIMNEAIRDNEISIQQNSFLKYRVKPDNSEKIFLTEEELKKFEEIHLDENTEKFHVRNIYVFACYAGGIRISDILTLRWENFNETHILLKTQKTGSVVSIMLPDKAIEILNYYKPANFKKSDLIFPFLEDNENLKDKTFLLSQINKISGRIGHALDEIGKLAGIEKHIHFHTSRHTWATRALKKGMRIEYVSKLMGHSSIRTTQVYAKIVNEDLDNAMKIFNNPTITPEKEK
ncbi:MAG: site-specific integrase [Bacteroidetes bacterium]|nr:site-specific integrase [Bacteroidota bacterium]